MALLNLHPWKNIQVSRMAERVNEKELSAASGGYIIYLFDFSLDHARQTRNEELAVLV